MFLSVESNSFEEKLMVLNNFQKVWSRLGGLLQTGFRASNLNFSAVSNRILLIIAT
jgi:hypothetical protein